MYINIYIYISFRGDRCDIVINYDFVNNVSNISFGFYGFISDYHNIQHYNMLHILHVICVLYMQLHT